MISPDVAEAHNPAVAFKVYVPALLSLRFVKVATPLTGTTERVLPEAKVPPKGPELMESVTNFAVGVGLP